LPSCPRERKSSPVIWVGVPPWGETGICSPGRRTIASEYFARGFAEPLLGGAQRLGGRRLPSAVQLVEARKEDAGCSVVHAPQRPQYAGGPGLDARAGKTNKLLGQIF